MLSTKGIRIRVAFINPPARISIFDSQTQNSELALSILGTRPSEVFQIVDHPQTARRAGVQSPGKQEKRSAQPVPECEHLQYAAPASCVLLKRWLKPPAWR
jgi:hypothetical protein